MKGHAFAHNKNSFSVGLGLDLEFWYSKTQHDCSTYKYKVLSV